MCAWLSRQRWGATLLFFALFFELGANSPAFAQPGFNLKEELNIPGVKMVAVEFFATWCPPCVEAVPRWKALHEKYQEHGLRLVVVVSRDPEGACVNPGWSPDRIICDDEGMMQDRYGARSLPAAFVWNWQGQLLANKARIEEIEAKMPEWVRTNPRAAVGTGPLSAAADISKGRLEWLIRHSLTVQGKMTAVANPRERVRLRNLARESRRLRADAAFSCDIGREVSANVILRATIDGQTRPKLRLSMMSVERGCLVAAASTAWNPRRPSASVHRGLALLTRQLRRPNVQLPLALTAASGGERPLGLTGRAAPSGPSELAPEPVLKMPAEVVSEPAHVPAEAVSELVSEGSGAASEGASEPSEAPLGQPSSEVIAKPSTRSGLHPSWLVMGAGVAAGVGAGVLWAVAESRANEVNQSGDQQLITDGNREVQTLRTVAIGTAVGAGAALGLGLVLNRWRGPRRAPEAAVGIVPLGAGTLTIQASGRF